jgi:hypothetical protein
MTRDREPESPGPLKYAPKWARMAAPETARQGDRPGSEPRLANPRPPERRPPPPRHREPARPQTLTKQKGSFEGDAAIIDLRERMARKADQPPEPPLRDDCGSAFGMVGRLGGLVTMAALAAFGFVWISTPQPVNGGFALAAYEPAAGEEPGAAPVLNNDGVKGASSNDGSKPGAFQSPPIQVAGLKADMLWPHDETPPADRPQVAAPAPWPAPDAGRDPAYTASLRRSPPAETESQTAPPVSTVPRTNDEEMANMLASGRTFLIIGDVIAARLAFRRAADGGDAQAALALGGTFDPLVLKSLGAVGVAADPAQARDWYQTAAELGSRDAPQRLKQLAKLVR